MKVRTRLYMVSPQQQTSADCNVNLMEKTDCKGEKIFQQTSYITNNHDDGKYISQNSSAILLEAQG